MFEINFNDCGEDIIISFITTVPFNYENEIIYGDLFTCKVSELDCDSIPVERGSPAEGDVIKILDKWIESNFSGNEVDKLLNSLFPRMDSNTATNICLLRFIKALKNRHDYYKNKP
jgi:hypothetical protein